MRKYGEFFLVLLLVSLVDQWTKDLIVSEFAFGESRPVIPGFFNLVLVYNPGAAFGMMGTLQDGVRQLVLTGSTLFALGVVIYLLCTDYKDDRFGRISLGGVVGGAIGNIIDRATIGKVVDFLDFHLGDAHWPAFNVADSAICIGVTYLVLSSLLRAKQSVGGKS